MKKILIGLSIIVLLIGSFKDNNKESITIPTDSIRLRVISNSNDELDIKEKEKLKDYIEEYLYNLIDGANNKEEVNTIILNNLDEINKSIYNYLNSSNYKLDYGQNFFPRKVYKGVIYEEGMYDSLVITLGNGKGKNWWCVLFPPICLLEENSRTTDVEYQLFVSRILDKLK